MCVRVLEARKFEAWTRDSDSGVGTSVCKRRQFCAVVGHVGDDITLVRRGQRVWGCDV